MKKIIVILVVLFGLVFVSCDNDTSSGVGSGSLNGSWLVTETFQTHPQPGFAYDMSDWAPEIYRFSGNTYRIYLDGNLNEEGNLIRYRENPYEDRDWYQSDPYYGSSYIELEVLRFDYNGYWLDYEKGPWLWGDQKRTSNRFYRFIDRNTLYLFSGSSSLNLTLRRISEPGGSDH